jgi:hypothetical protein
MGSVEQKPEQRQFGELCITGTSHHIRCTCYVLVLLLIADSNCYLMQRSSDFHVISSNYLNEATCIFDENTVSSASGDIWSWGRSVDDMN